VVVKRSQLTYAETTAALVAAIERRGLMLFARVDRA
jgi:uncharacterized protein (DUF302 family)